jgi:MYXO-CTERM domain-containing protein
MADTCPGIFRMYRSQFAGDTADAEVRDAGMVPMDTPGCSCSAAPGGAVPGLLLLVVAGLLIGLRRRATR